MDNDKQLANPISFVYRFGLQDFFLKWAQPQSLHIYFRLFKHTLQFLQQLNVKTVMTIQYMALGFELTTFGT